MARPAARLDRAAVLRHRRRLRRHLGRGRGHDAAADRGAAAARGRAREGRELAARSPASTDLLVVAAQARAPRRHAGAASGRHAAGQPARRPLDARRSTRSATRSRRDVEPAHARASTPAALAKRGDVARAVRRRRSSRTSTTPTSCPRRPSSRRTAASSSAVGGADWRTGPCGQAHRALRDDHHRHRLPSASRSGSTRSDGAALRPLPRRRRGRHARRCSQASDEAAPAVRRQDRGRRRDASPSRYQADNTRRRRRRDLRAARPRPRSSLRRRGRRATRRCAGALHVIPALRGERAHERSRSAPTPSCRGCGRGCQPDHARRPRRRASRARDGRRSTLDAARRQGRRRRHDRRPVAARRRSCTAPATSSASTRARSSAPSRATGSPTSSPTTCRTSSSTTRTSPGATPRPRPTPTARGCGLARARRAGGGRVQRRRRRSRPAAAVHRRSTRRSRALPARRPSCGRGRTCTSTASLAAATPSSSRPTRTPCCRGSARRSHANRDLAYSRLLCPRQLEPNTAYHAFLVPTFETGRLAGLGHDPTRGAVRDAVGLGRVRRPAGAPSFPYYYRWYFRTGDVGDFEYLVRLLEPRPVDPRVGRARHGRAGARARTCPAIDDADAATASCGSAARCACRSSTLTAGRARRAPTATRTGRSRTRTRSSSGSPRSSTWPTTTPADRADAQRRTGLDAHRADPDPLITPPLYGTLARADAAAARPTPTAPRCRTDDNWVHELNLDPRFRVAAGFGTRVVQNEPGGLHGGRLGAGRRRARGQPAHPARPARAGDVACVWHDRAPRRRCSRAARARLLTLTAPVQQRVRRDGLDGRGTACRQSPVPPAMTSAAHAPALRPRGRIAHAARLRRAAPTPGNLLDAGQRRRGRRRAAEDGARRPADRRRGRRRSAGAACRPAWPPAALRRLLRRLRWLPLALALVVALVLLVARAARAVGCWCSPWPSLAAAACCRRLRRGRRRVDAADGCCDGRPDARRRSTRCRRAPTSCISDAAARRPAPQPGGSRQRRGARASRRRCATRTRVDASRAAQPRVAPDRACRSTSARSTRDASPALDPARRSRARTRLRSRSRRGSRPSWPRTFVEAMAYPRDRHADVRAAEGHARPSCSCPTST